MIKGFRYVIYASLLWFSALTVNYISYGISDEAISIRDTVSLSFNQSEIPTSSIKDTDVNVISFGQRVFKDDKKDQFGNPAVLNYQFVLFFAYLDNSDYSNISGALVYQLPPFDFLTHQFLI